MVWRGGLRWCRSREGAENVSNEEVVMKMGRKKRKRLLEFPMRKLVLDNLKITEHKGKGERIKYLMSLYQWIAVVIIVSLL